MRTLVRHRCGIMPWTKSSLGSQVNEIAILIGQKLTEGMERIWSLLYGILGGRGGVYIRIQSFIPC